MQTRQGSTRMIVAAEPKKVDFDVRDWWSTHDRGRSPQPIAGLGVARTAVAVEAFRLFSEVGLPTHFLKQMNDHTIRVREFQVPGQPALSGAAEGEVIPLEWLFRFEITEKFRNRVRAGEISLEALGLPHGTDIATVTKLARVFVECSTKYEEQDRYLTDDEARKLAGLEPEDWAVARHRVVRGALALQNGYLDAGYDLLDGKFELGRTWDGRIMFVDWSSPDEVRIRKRTTGELHCKEPLRELLEARPWFAELKTAKEVYPTDKSKWPPYPVLSADETSLISRLYREVAFDFAGVSIPA